MGKYRVVNNFNDFIIIKKWRNWFKNLSLERFLVKKSRRDVFCL